MDDSVFLSKKNINKNNNKRKFIKKEKELKYIKTISIERNRKVLINLKDKLIIDLSIYIKSFTN